MRRSSTGPDRRGGFTLVELLVVITIIAILVSLTSAAVVRALVKKDEVMLRNDISQLGNSVQAFKTDFQVAYLTDTIVLPPGLDASGVSTQYISTLWPRIDARTLGNTATPFVLNGNTYTIYSYWGVPGNSPVTLQGHQALVFFLGGARDGGGNPIGFSASPTDPMSISGGSGAATRKGPYFEFPLARLMSVGGSPFPSFQDTYGTQPYLYFSSKKAGNDYTVPTSGPKPFVSFIEYANAANAANKSPAVSVRYVNPNGYQIISAGKDGVFGTGLDGWPGATIKIDSPVSTSTGSTSTDGYDDIANFHPTLLGISAN